MGERLAVPEERIDWRAKGFWWTGPPIGVREYAERREHLFSGAFTWPLMVARESALARNVAALADFGRAHGLDLAPHGKTSMAPALIQRQLDAGAWGVTAATADQVLVYRRFGVGRILLANELLDETALRWIAAELDRDPGFDFLCYADSPEGVAVAARVARDRPRTARPLRMLVERGVPGGRTGCRTRDRVLATARAVAAQPGLDLAGVAGYEGPLATAAQVRAFLRDLVEDAARLASDHPGLARPIVSVGGSAWFDLVAQELGGRAGIRPVLRSGAYVAHDDGLYKRTTPFTRIAPGDALTGALELWAQISSAPEPGLAIATMGRREANFDQGYPIARLLRRPDGAAADASGIEVTGLDDHHAYLRVPEGVRVAPGDLVAFGISHPCTAFDRWRFIPVADDADTVTEVLVTYF